MFFNLVDQFYFYFCIFLENLDDRALFLLIIFYLAGASMTSFVLLVEYSGVRHRASAGTNIWYFSSLCFMFLSLLAYLVREWRYLLLYGAVISLPIVAVTW